MLSGQIDAVIDLLGGYLPRSRRQSCARWRSSATTGWSISPDVPTLKEVG